MRKRHSSGLAAKLLAEGRHAHTGEPVRVMTQESDGSFLRVPIDAIEVNRDQPRKFFDEAALGELAETIRQKGVLQPVILKRRDDSTFVLVAGERRYRAAKIAALTELPAILTTGDEQEIALIENVQRTDLAPIEEAEALSALRDAKGYSHEELATVIGKSRVSVTELLSLNGLPAQVKEECRAPDIATKTHLLQVLREADPEKQLALWDDIKGARMSTKALRRKKAATRKKGRPKHAIRRFDVEDLDAVVTIRVRRAKAGPEEYLQALRLAVRELKTELRKRET